MAPGSDIRLFHAGESWRVEGRRGGFAWKEGRGAAAQIPRWSIWMGHHAGRDVRGRAWPSPFDQPPASPKVEDEAGAIGIERVQAEDAAFVRFVKRILGFGKDPKRAKSHPGPGIPVKRRSCFGEEGLRRKASHNGQVAPWEPAQGDAVGGCDRGGHSARVRPGIDEQLNRSPSARRQLDADERKKREPLPVISKLKPAQGATSGAAGRAPRSGCRRLADRQKRVGARGNSSRPPRSSGRSRR